MSDVFTCKTMPISGPKSYPKIGIVGDLGLAHNTTSTGCDTFVSLLHTTDQYKWLQWDLEKVDWGVTLWLVGVWHPPWYNTYVSHYKEVKCMRVSMEEILYNANEQTWDDKDTTIIKTIVDKLLDPSEEVDVAPFYTMFVGFSVLSQLSLHLEYFTSRVALVYLIISLGLPYNTTSDNWELAIELAGLVVIWERQRQNEMKIVNNGDGSS
uniref:Purple acid phosphatase 15 n=1 Tax=Tanacetum cinerariifolium TaxID=118510 RepID=A0A699J443_TANCI|nr:purple acid phosphatase 15 [Tanacetum cinerariifolium]